ncbi:MAG: hypothetical protein WCT18_00785, partial [Patescibacteria group bacterium]
MIGRQRIDKEQKSPPSLCELRKGKQQSKGTPPKADLPLEETKQNNIEILSKELYNFVISTCLRVAEQRFGGGTA